MPINEKNGESGTHEHRPCINDNCPDEAETDMLDPEDDLADIDVNALSSDDIDFSPSEEADKTPEEDGETSTPVDCRVGKLDVDLDGIRLVEIVTHSFEDGHLHLLIEHENC